MKKELYKGRARALYGQVALIDAEDTGSYPEWPTEDARLVFGLKGVVVAAAADELIEITVLEDASPTGAIFYGSGNISIGNDGLLIGNVVANTIESIPWVSGKTKVDVYGDSPADSATQITFVLTRLTN